MKTNPSLTHDEVKSLSNHDLETALRNKTTLERKITVEIISLLEEVNARKLYLQRGYSSLIEYCIKEFRYSESSAYRRVSAMRVVKEIPAIKESIQTGKLNLVTIAKAQTVFQKKAKELKSLGADEKSKILTSLESKSTRQAEKILLEIAPLDISNEKIKEVSPTQTQVTTILSEELVGKLSELKNLFSHKNPNPSYAELIEMISDFTLKKLRPKTQSATSAGVSENPRYVSPSLRQKLFHKADNRCQYEDALSKRRCESGFQLQIEHKKPVAKGGTANESNLEILCANHNRLRATQHFGETRMKKFLTHK